MVQEAEGLGANAILGLRFTTSQTMGGAAEILAYGTAVRLA
ncbi:MAG: heavy metal-binding domain-containing protein [Candidatus Bipolaricaulota bacterium]|nr:heavy metal-binding domain-containing protein [Candidatus Bipolaricaulota bacterium]